MSKASSYNVFNLAFWLSNNVAADASLVYANAATYFGPDSVFGKTTADIQKNIKAAFKKAGKKLLISAFGATDMPTSKSATTVCTNLANFAKKNLFDGVDLDYEDNEAFEKGTAEKWLIDCTKAIRKILPVGQYILTHAP